MYKSRCQKSGGKKRHSRLAVPLLADVAPFGDTSILVVVLLAVLRILAGTVLRIVLLVVLCILAVRVISLVLLLIILRVLVKIILRHLAYLLIDFCYRNSMTSFVQKYSKAI